MRRGSWCASRPRGGGLVATVSVSLRFKSHMRPPLKNLSDGKPLISKRTPSPAHGRDERWERAKRMPSSHTQRAARTPKVGRGTISRAPNNMRRVWRGVLTSVLRDVDVCDVHLTLELIRDRVPHRCEPFAVTAPGSVELGAAIDMNGASNERRKVIGSTVPHARAANDARRFAAFDATPFQHPCYGNDGVLCQSTIAHADGATLNTTLNTTTLTVTNLDKPGARRRAGRGLRVVLKIGVCEHDGRRVGSRDKPGEEKEPRHLEQPIQIG